MSLSSFFAAIGPYLEGRVDAGEARRALWGEPVPAAAARDAERLSIYGRFCRIHRFEALQGAYPYVRAAVLRVAGADAWERLVEAYFSAHPMHHVELNENGASLALFLDGYTAGAGLPAWLAELADFEWWEWCTRVAPDELADEEPGAGPLRLASTVEVRPYRWDFASWIDDASEEVGRDEAPCAQDVYILFWRDPDLDPRREPATLAELRVLKCVSEGAAVPADAGETLADLRAAGILLGA